MPLRTRTSEFFRTLQDEITSALEVIDGSAQFREDTWERPGGGGGRTRVLADGGIFEKAGVNFSAVHGSSPQMLQQKSEQPSTFFATGVSLVLHPRSPKIPTVHANFRYFEQSTGEAWFGGGMDLTPYYLVEDDAIHFHKTIKTTCDKHGEDYYNRFKKWCDEYFTIKHRGETRGVGGIFYDRLSGNESEMEKLFSFVQDIGRTFLPAYLPIVDAHRSESYSEHERNWQLLRHGRYVEFNLVYDKGTLFGLETGGRIESILMSLPTLARWDYDFHPPAGSPEEKLIKVLQNPREWIQ
ncbi:MAG: oxygen-dependent coproporphyrinogen oxidase [Bacteroidota bacterium]|nr:oxygen-dependent coproporphyrinogen oxidase [Bacteroidota bacterium]MDP4230635.1 oxygen-dependent coproporphyrinogen oxidase [Bacteroidota bacterium]MDP4236840.1 oxygen-dependent coproporphyrinogen oxidase [Bacteroidota bacterium]